MHNEYEDPPSDYGPGDEIVFLELSEGDGVIYDQANHEAWYQCSVFVEVSEHA